MKTFMAILVTAILSSLLSAFATQQTISNQWEFREQVSFNDRILLADGTTAVPSVAAIGDTTTGLSWPAPNQLAFSSGGSDLGTWSVATGTLTATQVRKLNATPVEVIAAPGSGKALLVESVQFMFDYGGTIYDSIGAGEDLSLEYRSSGHNFVRCDNANCIVANAASDNFGQVIGLSAADGRRLFDNEAADINILSGEWATTDDDSDGDSPIHYLIRYRITALDLS